MSNDERLGIRLNDLPKVLGIKRTAIGELIKKGDLPRPIRLGAKSKGIIRAELNQWLEARKTLRDA